MRKLPNFKEICLKVTIIKSIPTFPFSSSSTYIKFISSHLIIFVCIGLMIVYHDSIYLPTTTTGTLGLEKSHDLIGEILNGNHHRRSAVASLKKIPGSSTPSSTTSAESSHRCSPKSEEGSDLVALPVGNVDTIAMLTPDLKLAASPLQENGSIIRNDIQTLGQEQEFVSVDVPCLNFPMEHRKDNEGVSQNELTSRDKEEKSGGNILTNLPVYIEDHIGDESFAFSARRGGDGRNFSIEERAKDEKEEVEALNKNTPAIDESLEEEIVDNNDIVYDKIVNDIFESADEQGSDHKLANDAEKRDDNNMIQAADECRVGEILNNHGELKRCNGSGKTLLPPLKSSTANVLPAPKVSPPTAIKKAMKSGKSVAVMELTVIRREGNDAITEGKQQFIVLYSNGKMLFFNSEDDYINGGSDACVDELNVHKLVNRKADRQIQYKFVRDTIRNVQNVDSMNSPIVGDGCWEGELVCILCNKRREQTWSCMISMQMESTYIAKKLLDTINSFKRETFIQTAE